MDIKYLTQCVYKEIENPKGITLKYRHWDIDSNDDLKRVYNAIKSLVRSGEGFIIGKVTPLDYFNNYVAPLINDDVDPVTKAIQRGIDQGIGTQKDYDEFKTKYLQEALERENLCQFCKTGVIELDHKGDAKCTTQGCEFNET